MSHKKHIGENCLETIFTMPERDNKKAGDDARALLR